MSSDETLSGVTSSDETSSGETSSGETSSDEMSSGETSSYETSSGETSSDEPSLGGRRAARRLAAIDDAFRSRSCLLMHPPSLPISRTTSFCDRQAVRRLFVTVEVGS